jgi:hypothetical protein
MGGTAFDGLQHSPCHQAQADLIACKPVRCAPFPAVASQVALPLATSDHVRHASTHHQRQPPTCIASQIGCCKTDTYLHAPSLSRAGRHEAAGATCWLTHAAGSPPCPITASAVRTTAHSQRCCKPLRSCCRTYGTPQPSTGRLPALSVLLLAASAAGPCSALAVSCCCCCCCCCCCSLAWSRKACSCCLNSPEQVGTRWAPGWSHCVTAPGLKVPSSCCTLSGGTCRHRTHRGPSLPRLPASRFLYGLCCRMRHPRAGRPPFECARPTRPPRLVTQPPFGQATPLPPFTSGVER